MEVSQVVPPRLLHPGPLRGLAPDRPRPDDTIGREPFVTQFRGRDRDLDPRREPLRTIVADGASHALVSPHYSTARESRPASDSLGTLTTVDRYALVQGMNDGGAEMTTPSSKYLRTFTTTGHQALLTGSRETRRQVTPGDIARAREMVPEALFRMFEPHDAPRAWRSPTPTGGT